MSKETLEIIRGLSQAAANAYDGAHDDRFSLDGQQRQVGLMRGADIDSAMDMERVPEEHRDYVRERVMAMSRR